MPTAPRSSSPAAAASTPPRLRLPRRQGGKVIGVDVDQKDIIDGDYGEGMTVTSAMKGLRPTTINALTDIIVGGKWADYAGKIETLGLVSGDDPAANYVQLAETTQFADGKFSKDDYAALVKGMFDGTITVSNDTSVEPAATNVNVSWLGNLKRNFQSSPQRGRAFCPVLLPLNPPSNALRGRRLFVKRNPK